MKKVNRTVYTTVSVGGVLIALSKAVSPYVECPAMRLSQCDARPTVTFSADCCLYTKLYCLVLGTHVCERLA